MRLPFTVLAVNADLGTLSVQLIHPETRANLAVLTLKASTFTNNHLHGLVVGQTYEYVIHKFV